MTTSVQHEVAAQKAAENAYELLMIDEDDCVCPTCVVRVILEEAWPHLLEAARVEATTGVPVNDVFQGDVSACQDGALK
jgi:hypothetical protein